MMICKIKKQKALIGNFNYFYYLIVDYEFYENIDLKDPVCQCCKTLTKTPFYFCLENHRIICLECERKKEGIKTCGLQFIRDEHRHQIINDIKILGDN
jgi:hypothetical protein